MAQRGVDYDSLPGSLGSSPKQLLSKSWRRSVSNRAMSERGSESHTQAVLRCSQNLEHYSPQQSSTTKTLFSLHTTPPSERPPPPSPIAKSKFLSRSLTFSSLGSKIGKTLHSDSHSSEPSPFKLAVESTSSETDTRVPSQGDGPVMFAKSLFRSTSFAATRDPKADQSTPRSCTDPAPSSTKSTTRSSSFAHREQGFSIGRSLSRSFSSLSSHDREQGFKADSFSGISKWARSFRSKPIAEPEVPESSPYSLFSRSPSSRRPSSRVFPIEELETSFGVLTKGFLDSSKNAVKAVQDKARHLVSQNSLRYQDGGLHLDMAYITAGIIAVGFRGAHTSSSILGYTEANYQDLAEELIAFCETEHRGRYKIFNLCSEKLYDTSLLHDKVACFPFQGSNCPPLQLVAAFCESAHAWLKEGLENVVVVHCKGGMARTGLMISCLLLHLKFYPTAEESVNHYNQKRCVESNGLNLPSQLRYVNYYETVLRKHHGFTPTGRRCALRSIRLINCPTWICPALTVSDHDGVLFRSMKHPDTRSMLTEDLWLSAIRKGDFVFELPDGGRAATVNGDFKIQFQCYNVDFSCWLNTNLVDGNFVLRAEDFDGFDKGLQEAVGFQVELDLVDINSPILQVTSVGDSAPKSLRYSLPSDSAAGRTSSCIDPHADDEIKIFSDSEGEEEESPGMSACRSTEKRDIREQDWSRQPCDANDTTRHSSFQTTLFSAVPEISTGILNAMDRFGMTHLRGYRKSASMPNSSRISSDKYTHGSPQSADYGTEAWLHGSSRFQSAKGGKFTSNFETEDSIGTISYISAKVIISRTVNPELADSENPCASFGSEDPRSSFRSEGDGHLISSDPHSDFQALATASAADASLFSFVDEEDYESDEA